MGKLRGITVTLYERTATGIDAFGATEYTEAPIEVDNVLVGQPTSEDVADALDLYGKRLAYVLGIPKGDTHDWEDREVEFFGKRFRSFGFVQEGIEVLIPLEWNKKVMVELYGQGQS